MPRRVAIGFWASTERGVLASCSPLPAPARNHPLEGERTARVQEGARGFELGKCREIPSSFRIRHFPLRGSAVGPHRQSGADAAAAEHRQTRQDGPASVGSAAKAQSSEPPRLGRRGRWGASRPCSKQRKESPRCAVHFCRRCETGRVPCHCLERPNCRHG